MIKIVGVRFRNAGKVYYFDPKDYVINPGDHVIVETARGIEYGTVTGTVREVTDDKVVQPLKSVIRVATAEDDAKIKRNREREREALAICKEKIRKHELDMKLIDAEYTFDNNKVLFYFTADGRIDFRELVKDLAAVFRTRIELRQIGVRDETKILGGIGICGRPLCCHAYLSEFAPVSIKMAKEQNLSLNPTKISGVCGRLMCCLKNEEETYEYLNSKLPGMGDTVTTMTGLQGEVAGVNVLRQKVKVLITNGDEKELQEYDVADLKFRPRRKKEKNNGGGAVEKELRQLEELEKKEGKSRQNEGKEKKEGKSKQNENKQKEARGGQEEALEKKEGKPRQGEGRERKENRAGQGEASEKREGRSRQKDQLERREERSRQGETKENKADQTASQDKRENAAAEGENRERRENRFRHKNRKHQQEHRQEQQEHRQEQQEHQQEQE